jgi:hypothetical protein
MPTLAPNQALIDLYGFDKARRLQELLEIEAQARQEILAIVGSKETPFEREDVAPTGDLKGL